MAEPVYITVSGPVGEPLSHFRSALLTVATILSVLFLTLLTTIQPTLHKVRLDLIDARQFDDLGQPRPVYRVNIDARGNIYLNNVRCNDLNELRHAFDYLMQTLPEPVIEVRPDPLTRYIYLLETLAVAQRSRVSKLVLKLEPLRDDVGGPGLLHEARMPIPARRMEPRRASLTYSPQSILIAPTPACVADIGPHPPAKVGNSVSAS